MDSRCPKKLAALPSTPCDLGKEAVAAERRGETHQGCPWFVNSRESNFCFFKMMADDGRTLDTAEIARLLMVDDSEVKRVIARFRKNAQKAQDENSS